MIFTDKQIKWLKDIAQKGNGITVTFSYDTMMKLFDTIEALHQEIDMLISMWDETSNALVAEVAENEYLREQLARMREIALRMAGKVMPLRLSENSYKEYKRLYKELETGRISDYHNWGDIEALRLAHKVLRVIRLDDWPGMTAIADTIVKIEKQIGGREDGV